MKLRPDAASYVVLVLVASRAADSSRDASRDARRPRTPTPTHTRVSCSTHDDDSICFFDESRCFFARVRVSLSHCLPTHTNTHIDSPIRKSRSRSRVRSMKSIDDIRSMTSDVIDRFHRMIASIDGRWMRSIEIRNGGDATVRQTKTRGSVCVPRRPARRRVSLRRRSRRARRDGRTESRARIARARDGPTDGPRRYRLKIPSS